MAVAQTVTPLDLDRIRADFPILAKPVHGKRLVFLDSAASSQKPRQVIDTLVDVYETSYANVHRGVYHLGAVATERYEGARDIMARFVNAYDRREVIFVRQATEGLNLVAYAYGRAFVKEGDAIVTTEMEHHSNMVP
ncbi:MAG: cysteine desulfurase / selenocysteine lyase, partial [Gaiellales bacterium]|nr:cysteine desulfurase / selenocysteine lyase [Gaiellales bacterium]